MNVTSITLDRHLKARLDQIKLHPRESYNDVIARLLVGPTAGRVDVESLQETVEILSDPELMASIARGLAQLKTGPFYSIDEV